MTKEIVSSCPICEFEWEGFDDFVIGHYCSCNKDCDHAKDEHHCYVDEDEFEFNQIGEE
tara:strand:- start:346 stop:522 length:177 start_codon:yes stop_codon:yes gene_type:complete